MRCCSTRPTARRGRSGPSWRATMQPAHPGDASYALAAAALSERDFERRREHRRAARRRTRSRGCDVLVIAHPSDPRWERTTGIGSPQPERRRARRDRAPSSRRRRPDRARRDRAGQVRQQRQRAARALRPAPARTTRSRTTSTATARHLGARASCWTAARGQRRRPARARARGLLLPRDDGRRAATARACWRARTRRLGSRRAADRRVRARRRAGWSCSADSDLFGDDCIGDARPPRALAEHRLLGGARPPDGRRADGRDARADDGRGRRRGRGARCATRPTRSRCCRRRTASLARGRRPRRRPRTSSAIAAALEALAPGFPHQREYLGRPSRGPAGWATRLRQARLHPLAGRVPPRAAARGRDRAPRVLPDVQAERLARHVLRGADRAGAVAGLDRRARARRGTTTPSSCRSSWSTRRAATTASARCCSPRRSSVAERPAATTSARSSATARPRDCGAWRAPPPTCSRSTCRPTRRGCSRARRSRSRRTSSGT